jgi:thymidylate kinase
MLVAVEGPDGAGKDTIINAILQEGHPTLKFYTLKFPIINEEDRGDLVLDETTEDILEATIDKIKNHLNKKKIIDDITLQTCFMVQKVALRKYLKEMKNNKKAVLFLNRYDVSGRIYGKEGIENIVGGDVCRSILDTFDSFLERVDFYIYVTAFPKTLYKRIENRLQDKSIYEDNLDKIKKNWASYVKWCTTYYDMNNIYIFDESRKPDDNAKYIVTDILKKYLP